MLNSGPIDDFEDFLDSAVETEYGDFKRRADLHLMRLADALGTLSTEEIWQLRKVREDLLWRPLEEPSIEEMKVELHELARQLHHLEPGLSSQEPIIGPHE